MTVTIRSIEQQYIMEDTEFVLLQRHIGEELPVISITFDYHTGQLYCVSLVVEDTTVTLFSGNKVTFDTDGLEELVCTHTI